MHKHFQIFVEDASGKITLDTIMQKIINDTASDATYNIHSYRGCGVLPKNLTSATQIRKKTLLNNVPRLIVGFLNSFSNIPDYDVVFVVVTDCDNHNSAKYEKEILSTIKSFMPLGTPENYIVCLAIEEMEAWLLGDISAIQAEYPSANIPEYRDYQQDSICGTWETLWKVIDAQEYKRYKNAGINVVGKKKAEWARRITPHINIQKNRSPSFQHYVSCIRAYI